MAIDRTDSKSMHEALQIVQESFPFTEEGFLLFAQVCINSLITGNPDLVDVQIDMCRYLFSGPRYRMLQAQRGQAKTTLAGIYAAFCLMHNPRHRVVIFSQNNKRAKEISGWVIKIFRFVPFLHFMQPDEGAGDKSSVESYELHWLLRGAEKSASVTCQSIEAGAQGLRADLIIPDDIESLENSRTIAGRELLLERTTEFSNICSTGQILYLGTPQSSESIYNQLESKGFEIRIWPGRYPTNEEIGAYKGNLAPFLEQKLRDDPSLGTGYGITGKQGAATCPEMFSDEELIVKEVTAGSAKFQLQQMLNTELTDASRFPLKLDNLIVQSFGVDEAPMLPVHSSAHACLAKDIPRIGNKPTDKYYNAVDKQYDWGKFSRTLMFIDPSGGGENGDEMAYAIIKVLGIFVYVWEVNGVPGGYEEKNLMRVVNAAKEAGCKEVYIEENFGHGAHVAVLKPLFERHWPARIEALHSKGMKEQRIVDGLEPFISSHRLVVRPEVIVQDLRSIEIYPTGKRASYSLFYQMSNITIERHSLTHDDRLEALASACAIVAQFMDYDMLAMHVKKQTAEAKEHIRIWSDPKLRRAELTGQVDSSSGYHRFDKKKLKRKVNRFGSSKRKKATVQYSNTQHYRN